MIAAPDHLLSLPEWVALPEDRDRVYELQEGVLIAGPKPRSLHQCAVGELACALHPQLPAEWAVVFGVEVVTRSGFPASVRVPDVVVHRDDIADDTPHLLAEQVLLAIEVIAEGTRLTDTVVKPVEYARAGIPFYWVIDLADAPSLVAYRLVDGRYQEVTAVAGMFETNEPFPLRVDVAALARRA